jgi:outer membrane protein
LGNDLISDARRQHRATAEEAVFSLEPDSDHGEVRLAVRRAIATTARTVAFIALGILWWRHTVRAQASSPPGGAASSRTEPWVIRPYMSRPVPPLQMENSPRLHDLIQGSRLRLSLSAALALAIENNLDIAVQRYLHPIADADILRASSGQAARGVPGALLPSGLSAGALGVGVNQASGTGGVGGAGGISGGGGAVSVPQVGTFDPSVSISASYDSTLSPLNSLVVAGVPQVTTASSASSVNYTQLFPEGSSVTLTVNGIAQNSTQQSLLFNPAVISRLAVGVNQPLLNGFGFLPNKRFLMVAANNLTTSDELFRTQVTTIVSQVENAYWSLVAARQTIEAAQHAFDAADRLVHNTEVREQFGTAAGIDVVSAQSASASAERDLIVAQTNFQLQQAQLKSLISKGSDPQVDAVEIETSDTLPDPAAQAAPDLAAALSTALDRRPELKTAAQDLRNQDISVRFTRNGLLPTLSVFGLYAGAGLNGNTLQTTGGLGGSLGQVIDATYPEYAAGVSATVPIRNRSAQADNIRARLEEQQLNVQLQRSRQQVGLEVRQAVIGLQQGKAQVEAAHEALRLAERTADAERQKLAVGVSTAYDVILRERDLVSARQADVTASAGYAKALVEFERATGTALEQNGIALSDAQYGHLDKNPAASAVQPEARNPR